MFVVNERVLRDREFLKQMETYPMREIKAKVIVTDFNEAPLGEITGNIVSGTMTIDGASACRRTCNLTMITTDKNVNELDWQINTKYILAVGMRNFIDTDKYPEWVWFPLGVYVATDISLSNNLSGFQLTLTGKDKMCLLDGSVGGALFADHDFATTDVRHLDGTIDYEDVPIDRMIREAVHVYAKEPYENILINDLEDVSVELLDYKVSNMYCYLYDISTDIRFTRWDTSMTFQGSDLATNLFDQQFIPGQEYTVYPYEGQYYRVVKKLEYGDTAGYRRTELTYPGELVVNAGGAITDMLKKVADLLGEFEYFYDLWGRFVFQRKRIYHNVAWTGVLPTESQNGYFTSSESTQSIYDFTNGQIIESYTNKPQMLNIRNDWAIWGKMGGKHENQHPCHIRYAIDDKPTIYHCLTDGIWYQSANYEPDPDTLNDYEKEQKSLRESYLTYLKSFKYENSDQCVWSDAELEEKCNQYFRAYVSTKVVDYREILYRMAIDYSHAQARVQELSAVRELSSNVGLIHINALTGLQRIYGDTGLLQRLWYYDRNEKMLKHFILQDLETINEDRLKNKQKELSILEWIRESNYMLWFSASDTLTDNTQTWSFGTPTNDELASSTYVHLDKASTAWVAEGATAAAYTTQTYNGSTRYIAHARLTAGSSFNAITQAITDWEKRLNSQYDIYFADMLAFWPIYYKTVNDLTEDDVPQVLRAGLDYQSSMTINLAALGIGSAQTAYENQVKALQRATNIGYEERAGRMSIYRQQYKNSIVEINQQIVEYEENLQQTINDPENLPYQNYYTTTELTALFTYYKNYLSAQMGNLNSEAELSTIIELYETLMNNIKTATTNWQNRQNQLSQSTIDRAFQMWEDNGHWNPDVILYENGIITFTAPEAMLFWIDFMDTHSALGKYKIATIGHRAKSINDESIKAIFFRDVPSVLWIGPNDVEPTEQNISYVKLRLSNGLSNYFRISSQGKSAKDELDTLVYESTNYQETITVNCLPIYWFEPNQRIRVVDDASGIRGEYIIKSFNLSLAHDGMMSVTAYKAADRLI